MNKSALAVFAHPDDIEFVAAGTMFLLAEAGYDLHYFLLCSGNCGAMDLGPEDIRDVRQSEARKAAEILGAKFYPPIADDLELAAGMCGAASGWVPTTVGQPTLKIDSILVGGR